MLTEQRGQCAICGKPFGTGQYTRECVDHDHDTGKVRGLLCRHCNTTLGKFEGSWGAAARDYLQRTA